MNAGEAAILRAVAPAATTAVTATGPATGSAGAAGLPAALLAFLRAHSGETLSRGRLAAEVWRMNHYRASRTVDQTISVLRKQLPPGERIVTVFRHGYRHEFARPTPR